MEKKLMKELRLMTETDYRQLQLHFQASELCRGIMGRFSISDKVMAAKLNLTPFRFNHFKKGAYEYSIRDLASLQAIDMEYAIEAARERVESQIQFPEYKHSQPTPHDTK